MRSQKPSGGAPFSPISTFSGFMSRCRMFLACKSSCGGNGSACHTGAVGAWQAATGGRARPTSPRIIAAA